MSRSRGNLYFNSHPHEEDDKNCFCHAEWKLYFNSHPHEEDDWCFFLLRLFIIISTHILTRRMTFLQFHMEVARTISTHILTRRMTCIYLQIYRKYHISTHILTRRMTHLIHSSNGLSTFQLTSSRGGWLVFKCEEVEKLTFQLTSSRGGWQLRTVVSFRAELFQFTSSRGGWRSWDTVRKMESHFNSHPHEEDDRIAVLSMTSFFDFNSHPHGKRQIFLRIFEFSDFPYNCSR